MKKFFALGMAFLLSAGCATETYRINTRKTPANPSSASGRPTAPSTTQPGAQARTSDHSMTSPSSAGLPTSTQTPPSPSQAPAPSASSAHTEPMTTPSTSLPSSAHSISGGVPTNSLPTTATAALTDKSLHLKSDQQFATLPKKIGAILPLSGKSANMGQRALNAIRLGLGLNAPNAQFSLALFDSQGNPEFVKAGVEKLLKEDNVIAILGGLSAKEAQVLSERGDFFEVPVFTFSQKSGLTDRSDFTFQNAITPDMQMSHLVSFAMQKLNMKRFAVLYPNDAYGVEFANKFWDHVLARGGQITAAQIYDPKDNDLTVYVKKMIGTYYLEDRAAEYSARLKELKDKKNKKIQAGNYKVNSREKETQENILPPVVDFDAIFIPDSSRALGQTIAFMKANDVYSTVYLGTNLWNTPDLGRRIVVSENRVYFVDSESNISDVSQTDFYKSYLAQTQEEPHLLEAQTYEAAQIIKDLVQSGASTRTSLATELRSLGRRRGAYGEVHMNNSKEIERPLTILGLEKGQIQKF